MAERELPETVTYGEAPEEIIVEVPYTPGIPSRPPREPSLKLDTKAELGLRLFASGHTIAEAAKIAKTRATKIRALLATDHGKLTMQHIRLELDEDFKNLYRDSISALRDGMASGDMRMRLDAADKYLKYARDLKVNLVLSAEDLIKAIRDGKIDD